MRWGRSGRSGRDGVGWAVGGLAGMRWGGQWDLEACSECVAENL